MRKGIQKFRLKRIKAYHQKKEVESLRRTTSEALYILKNNQSKIDAMKKFIVDIYHSCANDERLTIEDEKIKHFHFLRTELGLDIALNTRNEPIEVKKPTVSFIERRWAMYTVFCVVNILYRI